jgi:hypothetical protein
LASTFGPESEIDCINNGVPAKSAMCLMTACCSGTESICRDKNIARRDCMAVLRTVLSAIESASRWSDVEDKRSSTINEPVSKINSPAIPSTTRSGAAEWKNNFLNVQRSKGVAFNSTKCRPSRNNGLSFASYPQIAPSVSINVEAAAAHWRNDNRLQKSTFNYPRDNTEKRRAFEGWQLARMWGAIAGLVIGLAARGRSPDFASEHVTSEMFQTS